MANKLNSEQKITIEEFEQYDGIFNEFGYRCNMKGEEAIGLMRTIGEKSGELQKTSKMIESQIEIYINRIFRKLEVSEEKSFYEVIINYYEMQLQGNAIEINKNSAICHLIRAAQKGKLPPEISTVVLNKLEDRKKKTNPVSQDDTTNMDSYMQNVSEIRLQQGRMPRADCNFIIKQAILEEKQLLKYIRIVERALEDFTEYELEDMGINDDYYVSMLDIKFFNNKNTNGTWEQGNRKVELSRIQFFIERTFKFLETTLHECAHADVGSQIESGCINGYTYKILKEQILRRENKDVNIIFLELLQKKPELLDEYPALRIEL